MSSFLTLDLKENMILLNFQEKKESTTLIFYKDFPLRNRKLLTKPILGKLIIKDKDKEEKLSLVCTDLH